MFPYKSRSEYGGKANAPLLSTALLMPRIPVIQISKNKNCWMVTWDNVGPEKCN